MTSLVAQTVKHLSTMQETRVRSLGREDPLEKEIATHSSTITWKIPWTEEPNRLHVVHGVAKSRTRLSNFTFTHWRRKWRPLQCSCLENPRDGGAWWAAIYGVAQSWTRLKGLSSSSSSRMKYVSCWGEKRLTASNKSHNLDLNIPKLHAPFSCASVSAP